MPGNPKRWIRLTLIAENDIWGGEGWKVRGDWLARTELEPVRTMSGRKKVRRKFRGRERRRRTESCIAVLGVISYGLADLGGRGRAPCDAGKLPEAGGGGRRQRDGGGDAIGPLTQ